MLDTFHTYFGAPLPVAISALLFFFFPLHGHVDDVQREVARQCGLAHFLLFQAVLYSEGCFLVA